MKFNHKVGIIVPSKIGHEEVDNSQYVNDIMLELSAMFGGASAIEQTGAWISDIDGLVIEKNVLVYAYCNELSGAISEIRAIARALCEEMKQDAIMIEYDGQAELIFKEVEKEEVA